MAPWTRWHLESGKWVVESEESGGKWGFVFLHNGRRQDMMWEPQITSQSCEIADRTKLQELG